MRTFTLDAERHTHCEWCGTPRYAGDTILIVGKRPYCNRRCSDQHHNHEKNKQRRERVAA